METAIRQIVDEVPKGYIFDSHFVINQLIKRCSDQYLAFASKFVGGKRATLAAHGQIGMEINKLDGTLIEKIGDAWSETIHTAPGRCTCWRKL